MAADKVHQILEKLNLTPSKPSSLGGIDRLYKEAKALIPGLTRSRVKEFLQTQYAYTQHKPAVKKFKKRKVIAVDINDVYQMDPVDMQKFAEFNENYKFLLTVIDYFSRYGMAIPIKSKKPEEIINLLREIEVLVAKGRSTEDACRQASISTKTYYRWRKDYGGMSTCQAKKLKDLEKENIQLKKLVADQALDLSILKEVSRGNF